MRSALLAAVDAIVDAGRTPLVVRVDGRDHTATSRGMQTLLWG